MDAKFEHLENILRESGRVLIAFSAGVDSTFLLKVAHDTLKERITALTASSASVPPGELAAAKEFAHRLGVGLIFDGTNLDDLSDHRPGLQAANQWGVRHPLVEAKMTKDDIRRYS